MVKSVKLEAKKISKGWYFKRVLNEIEKKIESLEDKNT